MNFANKEEVAANLGFWKVSPVQNKPGMIQLDSPDTDMLDTAVASVRAGKHRLFVNPSTFQPCIEISGVPGVHTQEVFEDIKDYIKWLDTSSPMSAYDRAMKGIV